MSLTVFGDWYTTAEATNLSKFQGFSPGRDMVLSGAKVFLIQNNDPTWTSVNLKLYSNASGSPRTLISTATETRLKSEIFVTEDSGIKEVPFSFDEIPLKGTDTYHLVLYFNGYTGSSSAHVAWQMAYFYPVYQTGLDITYESLLSNGYLYHLKGAFL